MYHGDLYLRELNQRKVLGRGGAIDCPLDYSRYGSFEYAEQLVKAIAYRNDGKGKPHQFGDDLAEGFVRAAGKWGRLDGKEGDLRTGLLPFPFWGCPAHMPLTQLDWSYGSILGDRDINEHDFNSLKYSNFILKTIGKRQKGSARKVVKIYTDKMVPFQGDMAMLDFSRQNRYSEHIAKLVAWHRYYTRFWKQSALFCDMRWPDFLNFNAPGKIGSTGISEPKFLNAVTGKNTTFLDGIQLGRKIWNLDHAIWTLQGRHRDMVHFSDYVYNRRAQRGTFLEPALYLPGRVNRAWNYVNTKGQYIDKSRFEGFKSRFYKLQGWEESTGYPTKSTLTSLGLNAVADELKQKGRLGKG
jgi:aldehyde:ferredoxin oxidoreductase